MKLLAIDGNSIINRAFYGIKLLTTKDGQYTNGVYGFINILNKLIELEAPDGIAVAFDLRKPTFRHEKYAEYKAGRKGMPDELASQMPILKEWLRLAGYTCLECEGFEADDILGTLATFSESSGHECVIATGDRDSLQLISEHTRVLLTATKMGKPEIINYTVEELYQKYSLTPNEMIELKALMGDSSDNIPGVAGVGEKTATDLISRYHSIDYIYEHLDELEIKDGVRKKLADGKESAFLSRELGTICKTAPINTEIENYKNKPINEAELSALMTRLEFFKLLERMNLKPTAAVNTNTPTAKILKQEVFTPDDSVDIYFESGRFAVISKSAIFETDEASALEILKNENIKKRVYDSKYLYKNYSGISSISFDTMLAGYLANPSSNDYSVERLKAEYSVTAPEIEGDADEFIKNAALFSAVSDTLFENLKKSGEIDLLCNIEIPLARVLADMENEGFLVDKEGLKAEGEELSRRISVIEKEIFDIAGYEFNLNSPKQLGEALFVKLGIPSKKKTKSGFSTNAEVLESLRYDYPIVELILEYRKLAKLKSTYCDGLLAAISSDNRIHTTFNQTETRTGRISSLEPNLQNIPVRTEEGKRLRKYFLAKEGYTLCDADYSQIELRVLASMANDATMISAFNNDADIHTITASEVFDVPTDLVTPLLRSRAKAVNFGIVYGIGAFSLSKDIGVTRAEADRYIKGYLATYTGVADYMTKVIEKAKADGFVTTLFGRRRYLPELSSSNGMLRSFGERVARNAPIQGTAADIIKIAMIKVANRLKAEYPSSKLILQVHDELIVECPENDSTAVAKLLEEEMENAASMSVKLSVDANCGKNWLEAKG
ncbi:MAG: DNA polymerase I [Oscillospiraceae bacterium]|nr:DNA polymerase I [Oscillospiraceae bacterium]